MLLFFVFISAHSLLSEKESGKMDDAISSCGDAPIFLPLSEKAPTSFISQVMMPLFVWDVVWLTCHRFLSWSFVARLNARLVHLSGSNEEVGEDYNLELGSITCVPNLRKSLRLFAKGFIFKGNGAKNHNEH